MFVANKNGTVSKITPEAVCTQSWATLASGTMPYSIAVDASGNVYTANFNNGSVSRITPAGVCTQSWATGIYPYSIAIDASGNVYTANSVFNTVSKISTATALPNVSEDGCKVFGIGKNIIVEGSLSDSQFIVYSIFGKIIASGVLYGNTIQLSPSVAAGVYLVKLNNKIAKVILN